mgnify:CR=1 FL=1
MAAIRRFDGFAFFGNNLGSSPGFHLAGFSSYLQILRRGYGWGQSSDSLKLESRFDPSVVAQLRALGHEVETIAAWDEGVGHAGMLILHANGVSEGGFDLRSNGAVASF